MKTANQEPPPPRTFKIQQLLHELHSVKRKQWRVQRMTQKNLLLSWEISCRRSCSYVQRHRIRKKLAGDDYLYVTYSLLFPRGRESVSQEYLESSKEQLPRFPPRSNSTSFNPNPESVYCKWINCIGRSRSSQSPMHDLEGNLANRENSQSADFPEKVSIPEELYANRAVMYHLFTQHVRQNVIH